MSAKIARPFTFTTSNVTTNVSTTTAWSSSTNYAYGTEVADPSDSTAQYTSLTGYTTSASCTCNLTSDLVTWTGNTLVDGDEIYFATSFGGVAAGLHYVINHGGGDTFQISTTSGGSAVNFTSNDTETCYANPGGLLNINNAITNETHWVASGPTNYWAMFDGYSTDQTSSASNISVTIDQGTSRIDAVQMLDMENITRITMSASTAGGTAQKIQDSENFSAATWTTNALSVTTNAATAPNGAATADKLIPSATNTASHYDRDNAGAAVGSLGATATFSVYLKAAGYNYARLRIYDTSATHYFEVPIDLTDGSVGAVAASGDGTAVSASSEQIADYYRISLTGSISSVQNYFAYLYVFNTSGYTSFAGDTTSGIYAWGMQCLLGTAAGDYVETVGGTAQNTYHYFKSFSMAETAFADEWYSTAGHYTETRYKRAFGVTDIPPKANADITIGATVTGTGKIGKLALGLSNSLTPGAQYGASLGIRNYSDITRDTYGTITNVQRGYSNKGNFEVWADSTKADVLFDILSAYRATPMMWFMIPDDSVPGWAPRGLFYGIYVDFEEIIKYTSHSVYNLELEGLGNG